MTFQNSVNISNIYLLDLFLNDNGNTGNNEIALIDANNQTYMYTANDVITDGFYDTGFTGQNISSIIFSAYDDNFCDYALAGIEVSAVPLPGAVILFGSALLGFFRFKRRRTS